MKIYHVCMAALAACALPFITACDSSELENSFTEQKQVEAKESVLTSKTRGGGIDKGRPIPWRVDPDTLPHRIRAMMCLHRRLMTYMKNTRLISLVPSLLIQM